MNRTMIVTPEIPIDPDGTGTYRRQLRTKLRSSGVRSGTLALIDQGLVSASRFITTVLVGRAAGDAGLGAYSLGFTLLMLLTCVQDSLLSVPFTVFGNRMSQRGRRRYAGSVLVHYLVLALIAACGLCTAAWIIHRWQPASEFWPVLGTLGLVIPFLLIRELVRRLAFAQMQVAEVLRVDVVLILVQLTATCALLATNRLTPSTAYVAFGVASALAAATFLVRCRHQFVLAWKLVPRSFLRSWSFSRWVLAAELASVMNSYVTYWLVALLLGTAATGLFTACMTIIMLTNPILLGFSNLLMPSMAVAFAEGGRRSVAKVVTQVAWMLGIVMGGFSLGVLFTGDRLLALIYGEAYGGQQHVISVLATVTVSWAVGAAASTGLRVIECPATSFRAGLIGLAVTIVVVVGLTQSFGLIGAAYGVVIGNGSTSLLQMVAFQKLARVEAAG